MRAMEKKPKNNDDQSALDAENLVRIIQTINFCSEGKTVAVVRVPSAHSDLLTHALDAGTITNRTTLIVTSPLLSQQN